MPTAIRCPSPMEFDALRIGVAERYDAWFEVTKPGAWLLQGLSSDPLAFQQAMVVYTPAWKKPRRSLRRSRSRASTI